MAKKKKTAVEANYLDRIPVRAPLNWSADGNGMVTLEVENNGWANRLAQIFFKRPKVSKIHLDELGSFVWPLIDGEESILAIGKPVEEHFGEKAQPLYPRLAQFFKILESYRFVTWKE